MCELLDTVKGQILNVYPDASVDFIGPSGYDTKNYPVYLCYIKFGDGEKFYVNGKLRNRGEILLIVVEQNIKSRRVMGKGPATWRIQDKDKDNLLAMVGGVVVCYGPSGEGGEYWEESSGRKRKSSYRRLLSYEDVVPTEYGFDESPYTFTEKNIKLFFDGKPLKDIDDYSDSRNVRQR